VKGEKNQEGLCPTCWKKKRKKGLGRRGGLKRGFGRQGRNLIRSIEEGHRVSCQGDQKEGEQRLQRKKVFG